MTAGPAEASRRLEAGVRLGGKYLLARRIAVGGMGEVWRARNETTGAEVMWPSKSIHTCSAKS